MDAGLDLPPALELTPAVTGEAVSLAAARARRFARRVLRPVALELDRRVEADHGYFPWQVVEAGAREGWLTGALPPILEGGGGLGITEMSVVMEEMCAGDAGVANIFGAHCLGMLPLLLSMDLDLMERVLGHVVRAERRGSPILCAFAITEPGGGSDVEEEAGLCAGDVRTRAVRVAGGYRVTGRKVFISNGSVAEYVVVFAALDPRAVPESWSAFVVRRGTPGMTCARVERKLGQRACPAAELVFEDAFVPFEMRVGPEGAGWELTRHTLAISRGPVGAIAVGIARDAFEAAWEYTRRARRRGVWGARDAWIDDALSEMVVRIRAARATYIEAARHCDGTLLPRPALSGLIRHVARTALGRRLVREAGTRRSRAAEREGSWAHQCVLGATAKIAGSEAAMAVTTLALDVIPPTAGELRRRAEKAFRDAKLTQIYEGTNQINRRTIARESWRSAQMDTPRS